MGNILQDLLPFLGAGAQGYLQGERTRREFASQDQELAAAAAAMERARSADERSAEGYEYERGLRPLREQALRQDVAPLDRAAAEKLRQDMGLESDLPEGAEEGYALKTFAPLMYRGERQEDIARLRQGTDLLLNRSKNEKNAIIQDAKLRQQELRRLQGKLGLWLQARIDAMRNFDDEAAAEASQRVKEIEQEMTIYQNLNYRPVEEESLRRSGGGGKAAERPSININFSLPALQKKD